MVDKGRGPRYNFCGICLQVAARKNRIEGKKMKHAGKRIFSVILCLCMIISLMPAALAAELGELVEKNEIAFDIVDETTIEPEESASPRPQFLKIKTEDEIKIEEALLDVAVESDLEQQPIELIAGEAVQLVAVSEPENMDLNLRWSSANEDVFIVDDTGRVTAVSAGTTAVLVETIDDENPLAACRDIVVTEAEVTDSTPDAEPAVNEAPTTEEEPPEMTPEPTEPPAVSRAEWIHGLVMQFSMTVDANNYPDNYYCDIDSAHPYYRDLMIAVEFGVIDLAAGLPFRPDEAATREFAAQTLNFCLGFRLDEGRSYTYSDFAACNYPDDDQIALDRGWFALIDSAFCPSFAITVDEQSKMLADAADILAGDKINTDHENTINYSEGVIAIPDGTMIEFDDEGNIRIVACPVIINEGDIFAFTIDGLPLAYKAVSVSMSHGVTVIVPTTEGAENAYAELDYEGTVDVDVSLFEPTGETNYYVGDMQVTESATIQGIHYDNGSKTLTASKTISLATGVKARINAQVSNLTVDLKANAATGDYAAVLHGNVKLTSNVNVDALAALGAPKSVDLGTVRILGGTVKITLSVEYSLSGELTLNWKGKIDTGFTYSRGSGFRVVKSFVKESFSFTTEVNIRSGLKLNAGINWLVVKADVWGKIGADMTVRVDAYDTGTPSKCTDLFGFMYASVGVKGKIVGIWSFNETKTIYDKSNSPIKVHYHYEDGSFVLSCSRGKGSGGSNQYSDYYTDPGSKNFSPGTWSGSYTGKDNEPVTVYTYSLHANNATITGYSGYSSALVIPSKIDGYNVTAIGDSAFEDKTIITAVMMADSILSIGAHAFNGCTNLSTISLPKELTEIGNNAFAECISLTEVEIPDSVTTIGYSAFANCRNLSEVNLPKNLIELDGHAFLDCVKINSITIPRTLKTVNTMRGYWHNGIDTIIVDMGPFCDCTGLREVIIEDGTTKIANDLFATCTGLEKIIIPSTVTEIGNNAFKECISLTEVVIPDSVITIGYSAFDGCRAWTDIVIPDKVATIKSFAFRNIAAEFISLPDSVTTLDDGVFSESKRLKEIKLPRTCEYIPQEAFANCTGLEKIVMPDTVTFIGASAFQNCTSLSEIGWSPALEIIYHRAFKNCHALKSVSIPNSVTKIYSQAFYDCDGLTDITIPDSVTDFGTYTFYDCDALVNASLGAGITEIPNSAFEHCNVLERVNIPRCVTSIASNAFKDCVKFKEIHIPRSVTSIDSSAFSHPNNLTIYGVSGTYAETFAKENNIKFVDSQIHATSAELSTRDLRIPMGSRQRLYLTVTPADFTDEVIWKASKPDIAYVDNTGLVSARDVGISTIKVTVGSVTVSCKVTVYQPVTSISLNQTSLTLEAAQTCKLVAYVNPSNAENRDVIWSSSDNSVALVDENGIVTAKTKGSAVITATAADGSGIKTSCTVTVPNTAYFVAEASQLESPHDYPNNCSDIWVYTHTGAGSLTVTFDKRTELEEDFDFLYIYDGSGNEIGKYTGTELAGASVMVPGDSVKLKLVSDNAGSAWGFKVTDVKSSQSEYVVSYDANGGSGAPEKQTKLHDKPLTLSSIKPTRSGYKFLGWATSKSATTAEYLPGGSYTANAAVTLYAVWKEDTRIPGDTNGDGVVNVFDLVRLKKYLTGGDVEIGMLNADVTGDGKIDVFDLLRLKKYLAGMAVELQ